MLLNSTALQTNSVCILSHSYANPQFAMFLNELEFAEECYRTSHLYLILTPTPF